MNKRAGEYACVFLFGFFLYAMLEIAGRGRTHWTMGLLGGAALVYLYSMEQRLHEPVYMRALLGAVFVTAAEFAVGVFDNLIMGWAVWDYTDRAYNLSGQICPLFSFLWFLLCFPACGICRLFRRRWERARSREAAEGQICKLPAGLNPPSADADTSPFRGGIS